MGRPKIAVVGAAGHTGRFVVAELVRRGIEPIAIARNREDMRPIDLDDPASIDEALAGAGAAINCAGPFLDSANTVLEAALRAGIHYLDVTAEQASALATLDTFDARARAAEIAVVPAAGFFGGFGDLLATAALGDWKNADEVTIAIALDRWWPTEGTRKTGARNTAARVVLRNGALVPQALPARTATWTFDEPFGMQDVVEVPLTEMVLIARHLAVTSAANLISQKPLHDLRDPATPAPSRDDAMGRSQQQFLIEAAARRGGDERRASARGQDIYAVTAPLVVEAAERIVGGAKERGAIVLGAAFDARDFLGALERCYPSLEISYR